MDTAASLKREPISPPARRSRGGATTAARSAAAAKHVNYADSIDSPLLLDSSYSSPYEDLDLLLHLVTTVNKTLENFDRMSTTQADQTPIPKRVRRHHRLRLFPLNPSKSDTMVVNRGHLITIHQWRQHPASPQYVQAGQNMNAGSYRTAKLLHNWFRIAPAQILPQLLLHFRSITPSQSTVPHLLLLEIYALWLLLIPTHAQIILYSAFCTPVSSSIPNYESVHGIPEVLSQPSYRKPPISILNCDEGDLQHEKQFAAMGLFTF
nr:uncharacterized protein LOC109160949 [Ipomoea batatas]